MKGQSINSDFTHSSRTLKTTNVTETIPKTNNDLSELDWEYRESEQLQNSRSIDPPNSDYTDAIKKLAHSFEQALHSPDLKAETSATYPLRVTACKNCHTKLIKVLERSGLQHIAKLLGEIQNEWMQTHEALKTLYESSVSFGINKALTARQENHLMIQKIESLTLRNKSLEGDLKKERKKTKLMSLRLKEQQTEEKRALREELNKLKQRNDKIQEGLEKFVLNGHEEIRSFIMQSKSQ